MRNAGRAVAATLITILGLTACDGAGSDSVSGTISMPPALQKTLGASDTLFITARPAGQVGGPPLAVLKEVGMKFPLAYTIGQEDVMIPGRFFTGKVEVQALIRKSGIVTVPVPGDMRGAVGKPVDAGSKGVDFVMDQADAAASAAAK